ncbi:MAG: T9SS type A sorting domain-containing protein [Bacteroidetes bacterium]|nr:MAG: T9SS type A sorting domain-containing protein [Bacteroidota bacterium]
MKNRFTCNFLVYYSIFGIVRKNGCRAIFFHFQHKFFAMRKSLRLWGTLLALGVSYLGYSQCAVNTFPYLEDFDGASWGVSTTFDACWPRSSSTPTWFVDNNTTPSSSTGPSTDHTGGNYLFLEASSGTIGNYGYVETPYFDLSSLSNPVISFYYHRYGQTMGDMVIEASLDSGASWCVIYRLSGETQTASTDPWLLDSANLSAVISSSTKLRFGGEKGSSFYGDMSIDSVAVYNSSSSVCTMPICLNNSNIGSSTADINWTSTNSSFELEYGPAGFTPGIGAGTTITATATTASLTGLTPATAYDVYVRSNCSSGGLGYSDWAGPTSFVTTCVTVATFPYDEDFDGSTWSPSTTYDPCWNITSPSSFRWQVNSGPTGSGSTGPNSDASGSGKYLYTEASSSGGDALMEMPPMDLSSLTSPELTFKYHMYGQTMTNLYIETSVDTGATWSTLDSLIGQQQSSSTEPWLEKIVDLTPGKTSYTLVRIRGVRSTNFYGDASVDEVSVHEAPPCPTPQNFSYANLTPNSVDITFTSAGSTQQVEWGPTGYTPGTGQIVSTTNDTVNVTMLPPGTCLDFYVQSDCSASGNGVSAWSGPYTICTPCFAASLPYTETFDNWPLDCEDPNVGQVAWQVYGNDWARAYFWGNNNVDFIMQMQNVDVTADARLSFKWSHSGLYATSYPNDDLAILSRPADSTAWDTLFYARAGDGNFDSQDGAGTTTPGTGVQEIILLPSHYTGQEVEFIINGHSSWGPDAFVNDFVVEEVPACLEPLGFTTTMINPDSVAFYFTADTSGSSWNIEWGPCGFAPGTGPTGTLNNDTSGLGGLTAATCYDLYIQTVCGSTGQSIWAGPFSFYTACDTLPLPWNEGFELMPSVGAGIVPQCWDYSTTNTFYLGTASGTSGQNPGPNSGTKYLYHRYSFNNEWWSFTPEFNLSAGQSYEFSFWYQTEGATSIDQMTIAYGAGQDPSQMTYSVASQTGVSATGYTQFVGTFIPPVSGIYHIGIMTMTTGFSGGINMDDFQLRLDPSPCPNVSSLTANIISENEVDLLWGATSSHLTFDVEWGPQGFTPATGAGRMVTGLTSPTLNIDTLSENTCYDYYVTGYCASGATIQMGPFTWCTPCSAAPMTYTEDFNAWPLNCVDPDAGDVAWANDNGWAEAYFWGNNNAQFVMNMRNVDISVDARVKFKWSHSGQYVASYPDDDLAVLARVLGTTTWDTLFYARAGDGNFASNDGAGTTTPGTGVNEILALDAATYTGNTAEFAIIGNSDWGPSAFVDDFIVEPLPSCPEPYSVDYLQASATSNSGVIYFSPGGASNFNIAYGPASTTLVPPATWMNATNDTVTLTGLTDNTTYNVWVRDSCGVGDVSFWTGPVQFTTLCLPYTMPYFEDYSSWPPACMDIDNGDYPWISYPGWAEADFWSRNDVDYEMTTPLVVLTDSAELSFKWSHSNQYATSYPYDSMQVRVRAVGGPWTVVWSRAGQAFGSADGAGTTVPGSGATEYIGLDFQAGDTIQVGFFAHSDFGPDVFVDDVQIYKKPACASPSSLGAFNETSTSADVFWTEGTSGATTWYVEYGAPGFMPGQGTSMMATNDTVTISGLASASAFCYYVTEICPSGMDSSSTVGPFCFGTLCPSGFSAPYFTDLEVLSPGQISTGSLENCWNFYNSGTTMPRWETEDASGTNENSLSTGPFYDHTLNGSTGGMYVFLECSGGSLGDTAVFQGPWVDASALNVPELSFWYHMYGQTMGNLYVEARDAAGMTWMRVDSIIGQQQSAGSDPWLEKTVLLNTFSSDTIQVRFIGERGSNFYSDMSLDDISIREAPTCPQINAINFTAVSTTGSTANWTPTVTGQTYEIEYGSGGFAMGSGTSVAATGSSYTFSGLPTNLQQEMYIRPICGANDTGMWTGPFKIELTPIPCDDFEAYNTGLVDEQSVLWSGWNNTKAQDGEVVSFLGSQAMHIHETGTNSTSDVVGVFDTINSGAAVVSFDFALATGAGGYYNILHNYTGPTNVWAIEVYMDANGTATVNGGTNSSAVIGTYQFNTTGWNTIEHHIDLDNDTAWIVVNGSVTNVGWQFSLGSVNFGDQFNAVNFYAAANTGQTPNYYIDNFCVCPSPAGFNSTNVTCTTVELDWSSSEPTSILEYGPAGFTMGSGTIMNVAAPYTVSGLMANTAYEFYVGNECNGDTTFVGPVAVTTANGPLPSLNVAYNIDSVIASAGYVSLVSGAANADSVYWDLDDAMTASTTDVNAIYTSGGVKMVIVTAYNDCGSVTDTVTFDVNISIVESELSRTLNIFPNPTGGVVTLDFNLDNNSEVSVSIINVQGQEVISEQLGRINSYNGQFDLSKLPKGVYIVRIQSGSHIVNRRVTLQ